MDAETFLGGGAPRDARHEAIMFVFENAGTLTYRTQYDGWIAGWNHSKNTGVGIGINIDIPAAVITVQGIYSGFVLGPQNDAFALNNVVQPGDAKFKFVVDDLINVRVLGAASTTVWMVLGRDD